MKDLLLERFCCSKHGVFGELFIDGELQSYTVERPWLNNKRGESCIPLGIYQMKPSRYNRGGYDTYEILDVPDRSEIKIHVANTMDDVMGCVGLGNELGYVKRRWAVLNSKATFHRFMDVMDGEDGQIIIKSKQFYGWG